MGIFNTLEERGLAPALDSLEYRAAQDSAVLRGAHQLAHALGRQALLRDAGDPTILTHVAGRSSAPDATTESSKHS